MELIEKLDAEKFLNRQLTLKLSEIDENLKETNVKLAAKDKEMIRIITSYNELENQLLQQSRKLSVADTTDNKPVVSSAVDDNKNPDEHNNEIEDLCANKSLLQKHQDLCHVTEESNNALNISIKEGMLRLQERFLKKMDELAELSDEKHRLEHIITQLQSETDTICEYVALYQQQRGILQKREEERKELLQVYEAERNRMKNQLDDLSNIISQFAVDKDLEQYFQQGSRQEEVSKIVELIANLKTNYLVHSSKQCTDLGNLYHCSWCSGKVIVV